MLAEDVKFAFDNAIKGAIEHIEETKASLLNQQQSNIIPYWSESQPFGNFKLPANIGVYEYFHVDDENDSYIGCSGDLNARCSSGQKIFRQKGIDKNKHYNGVKKMYEHDPDIRNWNVRYIVTDSKILAHYLESELGYMGIALGRYRFNSKSQFNSNNII